MDINLTAVFEKSPYGYIGYVEELPGANTQGETLEETKANLIEAVQLVLESNRQLTEEENRGKALIKEPFGVQEMVSHL
ncbi:MAG: type II toxin-antitoxin system HicB family antitoxin, partial [Candidatus Brocadiaceae bacterium]|nr:type II toxin-antitoxin system HicB family antitoxin [Candidatus Brocadiaceae bacterium]